MTQIPREIEQQLRELGLLEHQIRDALPIIEALLHQVEKEARISELERLQTIFQQHHQLENGYKHLFHEEAAEDISDRLKALEDTHEISI